jgi:hypothetical protein
MIFGGTMQSNIYANVGFRCESACIALKDYLDRGQVNDTIFEDSKQILNDCLMTEKGSENFFYLNEAKTIEIEGMQSILYDYITAQEDKKAVFTKLRQIHTNIGSVKDLKPAQVEELRDFFIEIVKLCKDKSQHSIFNRDESCWTITMDR